MLDLILAAGLAIFISAWCSVTEAMLYSIPWSYIERLKKEGNPSGKILHKLRMDVEKPITAVLTFNTIANTAGASVAGAAAVRVWGSEVLGVFAAVFTFAILIFSEIIPKTLGVAYCRPLSRFLCRPLAGLVWLLTPINVVGTLLTRLFTPNQRGPQASEDDILAIASLTRKSGVIKRYEEMAISNILTLDQRTVGDILTPRTVVFSLSEDITVADARDTKGFWHYTRIPVYRGEDQEDIIGVVHRRYVLEALANDQHSMKLKDILRDVKFVIESLTLDKLLTRFLESRSHLFVVTDEYGGIAGVVSLEDVMEEILGAEIVDETDEVADLRAYARRTRQELTDN